MLFALLCACALARRHRRHGKRATKADYEALARACVKYLEENQDDNAAAAALIAAPAIMEAAPALIESVTKAIGTLTGKTKQQEEVVEEPEPTPVPVVTYAPAPPEDPPETKQNGRRMRRRW